MDRKQKILFGLNLKGMGLEIGPSHAPIAPKSEGYQVEILDHLNQEKLIEYYRREGQDISRVEEVDHVWSGQPLPEVVGKTECYDWIIASHVVEHTPDLARFLIDCGKLLKPDGILSLAVPDKRACFDYFRPISSLCTVLDSHHQNRKNHSVGTLIENRINFTQRNLRDAWHVGYQGKHTFHEAQFDPAISAWQRRERGDYIDSHAWCFTPSSFRLIVEDLQELQIIQLRETNFFPSRNNEFFIQMSANGSGSKATRMELLLKIEEELAEPLRLSTLLKLVGKSISYNVDQTLYQCYSKLRGWLSTSN